MSLFFSCLRTSGSQFSTYKLCRSASEKSEYDTLRLYFNILFQKIILCTYLNSFEQEINSTNMKNFCFITQALLQEVNPLMMRVVSIVPNNLPTDDTDIPILLVVLLVYHNM